MQYWIEHKLIQKIRLIDKGKNYISSGKYSPSSWIFLLNSFLENERLKDSYLSCTIYIWIMDKRR